MKVVVRMARGQQQLAHNRFGRNIINFKIHGKNRQYTVPEDLVRARSEFFRKLRQGNRKAVEGECPICHEDLVTPEHDITFCRAQCGQNFHEACIEEREESSPDAKTCPMCQTRWQHRTTNIIVLDEDPDLHESSIQTYVDWLYSDNLNISDDDSGFFSLYIVFAWYVSSVFKDKSFRYAIIARYITKMRHKDYQGVADEAVDAAFIEFHVCSIRKFIVEAFAMTNRTLKKEDMRFPDGFFRALGVFLIKSGKPKKDLGDLLHRHTDGHYALTEMEKDESAADDTEQSESDDTSDTEMSDY